MNNGQLNSSNKLWNITNISQLSLSFGDLPTVPTIEPGETIDLLRFTSQQIVSTSSDLANALDAGYVVLEQISVNRDSVLNSSSSGGGIYTSSTTKYNPRDYYGIGNATGIYTLPQTMLFQGRQTGCAVGPNLKLNDLKQPHVSLRQLQRVHSIQTGCEGAWAAIDWCNVGCEVNSINFTDLEQVVCTLNWCADVGMIITGGTTLTQIFLPKLKRVARPHHNNDNKQAFIFADNALSAACQVRLLATFAAMDGTNGTTNFHCGYIDLSGGDNAYLPEQALQYLEILNNRDVDVSYND